MKLLSPVSVTTELIPGPFNCIQTSILLAPHFKHLAKQDQCIKGRFIASQSKMYFFSSVGALQVLQAAMHSFKAETHDATNRGDTSLRQVA